MEGDRPENEERPTAFRSADPPRNFTLSVDERVRALTIGPPAYAVRKRKIEDNEEQWVSTLVALHDERTALDWIAGSRPGPAMTVLLAGVLERLAADGLERFDFGGANVPTIAEFKRKFGGHLVPYFHARHVGPPVLRLLDRFRGA